MAEATAARVATAAKMVLNCILKELIVEAEELKRVCREWRVWKSGVEWSSRVV